MAADDSGKTDGAFDPGALIEAIARDHDRASFTRLFGHFAPRIKAYCLRRGANPATAEETAQETLIQVWRRAGQFDRTKASATTWVFTIARNKRIDLFRREQRPEVVSDDLPDEADDAPDPMARLEMTETGSLLAESVDKLPADQAEVIRKAFYEDKTHQVIAEELGLPLGTVKSRIRLALARMRDTMTEYR